MNITKKIIATRVSKEAALNNNTASELLKKTLDIIIKNMISKTIKISGFGSFKKYKSPQRLGRNPKTLESFIIPKRSIIRFKASKKLKININ